MALRIVIDVLIGIGAIFALAGTIGILKMPDTFSRMQASTCVNTMGVIGVALGALLYAIFQTVVEGRLKARNLPVDAENYENIPPRPEEPGQKKRSLLSRLRKGRG